MFFPAADLCLVKHTHMKQHTTQGWGPRYASYWLTLVVALGIIFVGLRFIIAPAAGAAGYGIELSSNAFSFAYIKGIRDIFSGLVLLPFLLMRKVQPVAFIFCTATIIPLTDCCIVLVHNGPQDIAHLLIHGLTAVYMLIVSFYLFRTASRESAAAATQAAL